MRAPDSLACQWFERVWNQGDAHAIDHLAAPEMRAHGADGVTRTPAEFKAFQTTMRAALPDIQVRIVHAAEGGSMAAVHWVATGTHTGESPIGPPTGGAITVSGLSLVRMENGRIVEGWDDYDYAGMLAQLGVGV